MAEVSEKTAKSEALERARRILIERRGSDSLQKKVQQLREESDPSGPRRVMAIENLLEGDSPNKVESTPPQTLWMRPEELWIDGSYQRHLSRESLRLIIKIITSWSWEKFKPPVVTRDSEGRYFIIDGQHTSIAAASHPDIDKIPVMFIPIDSVEDAALAFIAHNRDRVLVTPYARFKARLRAKDATAMGVERITKQAGINVSPWFGSSGSGEAIAPNQTMATGELEKRYLQLGETKFSELCERLAQCAFKPLRREHIVAFAELMYGEQKNNIASHDLLVEVVQSLSDADCWLAAGRLNQTVKGLTRGKALAMHYLSKYRARYGEPQKRRGAKDVDAG